MSSIIKVDTIQTAAGGTPGLADLGITSTGSILQTKQSTGSLSRIAVSSTSWAEPDTSMRLVLTPSSTSNKFIIMLSGHVEHRGDARGAIVPVVTPSGGSVVSCVAEQDASGGVAAASLLGTNTNMQEMFRFNNEDANYHWYPYAVQGTYTPTSLVAHTFSVYAVCHAGANLQLGDNGPVTTLTVTEIAG